jgi:hypothetical protein
VVVSGERLPAQILLPDSTLVGLKKYLVLVQDGIDDIVGSPSGLNTAIDAIYTDAYTP